MTEQSRLDRYRAPNGMAARGCRDSPFSVSIRFGCCCNREVGFAKASMSRSSPLYCIFVLDYLARLYLAQARGKWFLTHLRDLPVIVLPFFRPLRLLSLAVVVTSLQQAVGHTIRGRVIVYTACGASIVVYAAALAILDVEGNNPDAKIRTLGDARVVGQHNCHHRRIRRSSSGNGAGPSRRSRLDGRWHHLTRPVTATWRRGS